MVPVHLVATCRSIFGDCSVRFLIHFFGNPVLMVHTGATEQYSLFFGSTIYDESVVVKSFIITVVMLKMYQCYASAHIPQNLFLLAMCTLILL